MFSCKISKVDGSVDRSAKGRRQTGYINLIVAPCIFCRITSIYQSTNAHIISHKTLLKHFKTLRHVSILSDHHQGALFLAKCCPALVQETYSGE